MFVTDFHEKQKTQKFIIFCFLKISLLKIHETTTFRASLKPQGPRGRACGKEREILCRIALTRALYDQMAPQLCHFYVPGKLRSFSSSEVFACDSSHMRNHAKIPRWAGGPRPPGGTNIGDCRSNKSGKMSEVYQVLFCLKISPLGNHEQ